MKETIREKFKILRRNINKKDCLYHSEIIIQKLSFFLLAQNFPVILGAYWPLKDEINIIPLLRFLNKRSITCSLPVILNDSDMQFQIWTEVTKLSLNHYSIFEPVNTKVVKPNIVIIPSIVCDLQGNRLGYGKGYYDKYLGVSNPANLLKIGVCYEMQIYEGVLPNEKYDQKLDIIFTEKRQIKISESTV